MYPRTKVLVSGEGLREAIRNNDIYAVKDLLMQGVDDNFASMPISSLFNKELKSGLEGKFVCFLCQHIQQTDIGSIS